MADDQKRLKPWLIALGPYLAVALTLGGWALDHQYGSTSPSAFRLEHCCAIAMAAQLEDEHAREEREANKATIATMQEATRGLTEKVDRLERLQREDSKQRESDTREILRAIGRLESRQPREGNR